MEDESAKIDECFALIEKRHHSLFLYLTGTAIFWRIKKREGMFEVFIKGISEEFSFSFKKPDSIQQLCLKIMRSSISKNYFLIHKIPSELLTEEICLERIIADYLEFGFVPLSMQSKKFIKKCIFSQPNVIKITTKRQIPSNFIF